MSDETERWCEDTENWLAFREIERMLYCLDSTTSWGEWRGNDG
jgi:hypothetical protein